MKQRNSKIYWLVFVGVVLVATVIVFCIWLPQKDKTKAPDSNLNMNINQNINNDVNVNNNLNSTTGVNNNSSSTSTNTNAASVNPDSSVPNSNQTTTDYNAVQGGNFDQR